MGRKNRWRGVEVFGIGLLLLTSLGCRAAVTVQEGEELLGTPAPAWTVAAWINSQPLTVEQLKGKVVLLRWWTAPDCPFCEASAPYLHQWHERYADRGLVVIGMYHPKPPGTMPVEVVRKLADGLGLAFPLAIDPNWETLHRYWLDGNTRSWTSVSFLIDQEGLIRYVHPGGSYSPTEAQEIEALIEGLLVER